MFACKPDGTDYGWFDRLPKGYGPCAQRPTPDHIFTGTVSENPDVMWRQKTETEQTEEKYDDFDRWFAANPNATALVEGLIASLPAAQRPDLSDVIIAAKAARRGRP